MTTVDRNQPIVKLKLDVIFKRVFGNQNNKDIIAALLSALLEIPRESIEEIYIENVELAPEYLEQKFSRLDLRLNVDGQMVNVEMQVNYEPDFKERTLFYWSKMFSEELRSGEEYGDLKRTVCINIINFDLFDCADYHSHFQVMESSRHEILSDKLSIHFVELKKLDNVRKNQAMEDWLHLIDAETEGELMELQQRTMIPEVKETIVMLRQLSADEQVRRDAYYREKRLHDEATAIGNATRKGRAEGRAEVKNELMEMWRQKGFTEEQIKELLGE